MLHTVNNSMLHTVNASGLFMEENVTVNEDSNPIGKLDFYLSGIVLLVVCVLGLVCNSLVMIVLTQRSMRTSTNCFLLALALFDSIVLICTSLLICFKPLSDVYRRLLFPYAVAYIYPLALIAQTCTIWITVSFTVERCIAVTHPLKASRLCTIKRARFTTMLVALLSIAYNFSRWFEYKTGLESDGSNTTTTVLKETALEQNTLYETIYFAMLYMIVMCIVPILLLTVLNAFLILAVRRSRRERRNMGNTSATKENNITIMLVSVVVVFIICQVPALVYSVAYGISKKRVTSGAGWMTLSIVRNFMVALNSAVNFILYCAFGQKFRKVFLRLFCRQRPKREFLSTSQRTALTTNGSSSANVPMLDKNSNSTKSHNHQITPVSDRDTEV